MPWGSKPANVLAAGGRTDAIRVPSEYVIRDCIVRTEPGTLDRALNMWNQAWGAQDEALAMDGKTMKNAVDEMGRQTHIMSVVGHESKRSYAQKK